MACRQESETRSQVRARTAFLSGDSTAERVLENRRRGPVQRRTGTTGARRQMASVGQASLAGSGEVRGVATRQPAKGGADLPACAIFLVGQEPLIGARG